MGRKLVLGLSLIGLFGALSGCDSGGTAVQPKDDAAKERMRALGAQERGEQGGARAPLGQPGTR
jgi:hypothetical protein